MCHLTVSRNTADRALIWPSAAQIQQWLHLLQVTLAGALLHNNTASKGGGISLQGAANATLDNTTVEYNEAQGSGGGVFAGLQASLVVTNGSSIRYNIAKGTGGGVACADSCRLRVLPAVASSNAFMQASVIHSNVAKGGWGGGVLDESANFVASELVAATHSNSALYAANVHAGAAQVQLLSEPVVTGFVSRLGVDEGVLHAALRVLGHQGLPSEGALVQAILSTASGTNSSTISNQYLASNRTDSAGNASLSLKIVKAPGQYSLSFALPEAVAVPAANMSLSIRACERGEVTPSPDSCLACPSGYFSLDPADVVCIVCMPGAECPGGSLVVPQPGFWMSTADSNQVHR
jgi:hypothetical protein